MSGNSRPHGMEDADLKAACYSYVRSWPGVARGHAAGHSQCGQRFNHPRGLSAPELRARIKLLTRGGGRFWGIFAPAAASNAAAVGGRERCQ